jgi:hypothetical protein
MCSSVSFALQNMQSGSVFLPFCYGVCSTSSQSGYRHLIAPFQLLSVILPTSVLLSLFHCILPLFLWWVLFVVRDRFLKSSFCFLVRLFVFGYSSMSWHPTWYYIFFSFIHDLPNLSGLRIFRVVVSGCVSESVNITPLTPVVDSLCIAPMMASCSALIMMIGLYSCFVLITER